MGTIYAPRTRVTGQGEGRHETRMQIAHLRRNPLIILLNLLRKTASDTLTADFKAPSPHGYPGSSARATKTSQRLGKSFGGLGSEFFGAVPTLAQAIRYAQIMRRRVIALLLTAAMGLQGPLLAYAAAPGGTGPGSATVAVCPEGTVLQAENDCSWCCSHGSMPTGCIAVCAVPMATPEIATVIFAFALTDAPPTSAAVFFVGPRPVPLIRPPIV